MKIASGKLGPAWPGLTLAEQLELSLRVLEEERREAEWQRAIADAIEHRAYDHENDTRPEDDE